jgi:hypothetical protein
MIGLIVFNVLFIGGCVTALYHAKRSAKIKIGKSQDLNAMDIIIRMSKNNNNMDISINEKIDINNQLKLEIDILASGHVTGDKIKRDNVRFLANYVK